MPKHTMKKKGDFRALASKIYGNRMAKRHHKGRYGNPQNARLHPTARRGMNAVSGGSGFNRKVY